MAGRWPDRKVGHAASVQRWEDLTFLHWPLPVTAVQELLPPGLVVDRFDGQAWLGVTPFRMHARPSVGPAVPHLSHFPEVNVRTYVRGPDGGDGLWFFSLECPRLPVVLGLRALGVPYVWADAGIRSEPGHLSYRTRRHRGGAGMRARVAVGPPVAPDERTDFLTGRWSAYVWRLRRLWRVDVEHEPWPLHAAEARVAVGSLVGAAGLPPPGGAPLAHHSPGVHARVAPPVPV